MRLESSEWRGEVRHIKEHCGMIPRSIEWCEFVWYNTWYDGACRMTRSGSFI